MKGLSPSQLEALTESLKDFSGAYLQKIGASDRDLVLAFWTKDRERWLWVDLHKTAPFMAWLDSLPSQDLKKKPPVVNFLRAHLIGLPLVRIEFLKGFGRVVSLKFGDGNAQAEIEIQLIPHAPNVVVKAKGKSVAWNPPKELQPFEWTPPEGEASLNEATELWLKRFKKSSSKALTKEEIENRYQKQLQKAEKAVGKVEEEVQKKQDPRWRNLGEWLKANQSLNVPPEYKQLLDPTESLAVNIERAFKTAKDNEEKLKGTLERLAILKAELRDLRDLKPEQWFNKNQKSTQTKQKQLKANFKARSFEIDENTKAYFGKSGADNLKLLRQARAWDYWVHLKDEPGSHGILFRPKNLEIEAKLWPKLGEKLVEYSLGEKAKSRHGDRFELLVCEVRYVRPIKGDRLGRVNYQNEKVIGFTYK